MAPKINYELVYRMRKYETSSLQNLVARYQNKARQEAEAVHEKYLRALQASLGHDRIDVTNALCMADGISGHVYTWDEGTSPATGIGKRWCVFCGCDDFDGY